MTARQELHELHKKYGFMVNDSGSIPYRATVRRRSLAKLVREESWLVWMRIPQPERMAMHAMVDRAKSSAAYKEAVSAS